MIRWLYEALVRRIGPGVIPWLRSFGLAEPPDADLDLSSAGDFIEVHDRGSDVTVFAFAGMAAQHGGMVNFEFKSLLRKNGADFNFVFLRDIRCAGYQLTPANQLGGLDFFRAAVERTIEQLGSRINVSLGTSVGACAALEFASRCGLDMAMAFSPTWPPENYDFPAGWRNRLSQLRLLLRSPASFFERFMLFRAGKSTLRVLQARIVDDALCDPLAAYRKYGAPRRTLVYFGEEMDCDRLSATRYATEPGVQLVPLPTERHNTTGVLKRQGRLGREIVDQVHGLAAEIRGIRPGETGVEVVAPSPAFDGGAAE